MQKGIYYCDVQVQSFLRTKAPNNVLAKKKSKSIIEGNRFIYTPHSNLVIKSKLLDVKKVFDSKTKVEHSSYKNLSFGISSWDVETD